MADAIRITRRVTERSKEEEEEEKKEGTTKTERGRENETILCEKELIVQRGERERMCKTGQIESSRRDASSIRGCGRGGGVGKDGIPAPFPRNRHSPSIFFFLFCFLFFFFFFSQLHRQSSSSALLDYVRI
jgi:hypothetical protein